MYIVENNRLTVTRGLCQPYIARNDGFEDLLAEETPQIGADLLGERGSLVIHGEEDSFNAELAIQSPADAHERVEQFRNSFEREVFTLNRHENCVAGSESIQSEQVERGRTIEQREFVIASDRFQKFSQTEFPLFHGYEFDDSAGKIFVRGNEVESLYLRLLEEARRRLVEDESVIEGSARRVFGESERSGRVGLGIAIDDERAPFRCSQGGTEVDDRGGLADTAFLIGNSDDPAQSAPRRIIVDDANVANAAGGEQVFHVEHSVRPSHLR